VQPPRTVEEDGMWVAAIEDSLMSVFDFLFRSQRERVHAQIAPMLAMLLADGKPHPNEMKFIAMRLGELGVPPSEFEQMLRNPPKFVPPSARDQRLRILVETALVMLADGSVDPSEMALFVGLTHRLELTAEEAGLALLAARELMKRLQPGSDLDSEITTALTTLGSR